MMRMLKKIAGWSWKKKIIVIICVVLTLVLGAAGAVFGYAASKVNKIQKIEVKKETLKESITEEVEHKSGYLNVAVFGLDSRDGSLDKGNRSDTIMIVSLNQETYEVKMVSVYRDTFMRLKDGSYNKANAAYSYFGPDGGVALLNENMDMNIEKYVSVNFNALVDVIDAVGGMDLELTDAEVVHMNNYCVETSEVTGKSYKKIEPEVGGSYHLNGVQVVSYCRIRYTSSMDMGRTERQRRVIGLMVDKAKKAGITTIFNIMDQVFPLITTSVSKTELLNMVPSLIGYNIADTTGFPSKYKFADVKNASMVVADTLEENVKELHAFLYGADESYEPSQNIIEANDKIIELVGGADTLVDEAPAVTSDDTSSDVVWQGDGSGNYDYNDYSSDYSDDYSDDYSSDYSDNDYSDDGFEDGSEY